jgi:DNA-binding transcriptional LysR family regulator
MAKKKGKRPSRSSSAAVDEAVPASGLLGSRVNLHRLDIFVSVAQTGSMSAAAKKFGLTQPAVSQAIRKLEEVGGFELFDRSIRPPKLTLRGGTFLNDAVAVVESIRRLEVGLRFGESAPLPALRIGMLNSFASTLGPFVIKILQDSAAHWYVDTGFEASRIIALLDRRFDFIITADETKPPPGVVAVPLFSEPYRIVVSSALSAATESLVQFMSDMNMIRFGRDPNMLSRIDHWLNSAGIKPPKRYHLDTIEGTVQMVGSELGWSLLPPLAVFRLIERGEPIKTFRFPGEPIRRTISLVSREGEGVQIAEKIRSVAIGLLKERFLPSVEKYIPDALSDIVIY